MKRGRTRLYSNPDGEKLLARSHDESLIDPDQVAKVRSPIVIINKPTQDKRLDQMVLIPHDLWSTGIPGKQFGPLLPPSRKVSGG